jgi:hypothetical protein
MIVVQAAMSDPISVIHAVIFNGAVERPGSAPAEPEFGFISLKG